MEAVSAIQNGVTKNQCTELKAMNSPPADVATVITTFADFVEGGAATNTWKTANRKMQDYIKRGVGINERVSPQ